MKKQEAAETVCEYCGLVLGNQTSGLCPERTSRVGPLPHVPRTQPSQPQAPETVCDAMGIDINDSSPLVQLRRHHEWQIEHGPGYINSHLYLMTCKALQAAPQPERAPAVPHLFKINPATNLCAVCDRHSWERIHLEAELASLRSQLEQVANNEAALKKHLDAAYEVVGLSPFSSRSLASTIRKRLADAKFWAWKDALEEAARVVCPLCAGINRFVRKLPAFDGYSWFHNFDDTGDVAGICKAASIRALAAKAKEQG